MSELVVALVLGGVALSIGGAVWLVVVAFKESVWWGLGCFLGIPALIFLVRHWPQAKIPCLASVLGAVLAGIGGVMGSGGLSELSAGLDSRPISTPMRSVPRAKPTLPAQALATPSAMAADVSAAGAPAAGETPLVADVPPGIFAPPRQETTPTRTTIEPGDLAGRIGEPFRFRLKDGRVFTGRALDVKDGMVRIERSIGLGTSSFDVKLEAIEEILVLR